ncbi:Hpt domain-containing protein [Oxalicibacterium faecigallinarum]|uniref:Chemotaxis protein CheA n=1 Tax=Oxalicibacterium faecigallinarum TaxID=573741 RepID=A0A8J3AS70_9BURK|nr:Hpt domain-containing protein [Oxalicibacterium faecigallinarum]GGI20268.1 hypothetical protein GCM10008066_23180 [Oxalicibacterium faecigallinarum]
MNTPSSSSSPGGREPFDTGPLSWVIGEISEALTRSRVALGEALSGDADTRSTSLRQAKAYLHQAHGALQIIDVDGVAIITETVEELFERFEAEQLELNASSIDAIVLAYQALVEYLEELLAGLPHQPVRLFPYYRGLLEVRGAERIHPADLFFPNLAIRPQLPAATQHLSADDYVGLRKRFERALLTYLKSDAAFGKTGALAMRDVVQHVESAQTNSQARAFWWVMAGFTDAVASGQIPAELYVKQLFARINLQIRRLGEGSFSIAERLLRDALFFIARIQQPSPAVQQICMVYQLDGVVPQDYETRRYGQVDVQSLAAAKERLAQAKILWNRLAGGDAGVVPTFELEMNALADAGSRLATPALSKLLKELSGIARHAAHTAPGDALSLEIATSLLFVEHALQQITHLPDDFSERADALTARLLSAVAGEPLTVSASWLDEMSREAQQRQTMAVLSSELQSSLRQVEKGLDAYFRDPQQRAGLSDVNSVLYQISGALAVLDHDDAVRATRHVQDAVRGFLESDAVPDVAAFEQVANNVGALGFFLETLQLHDDGKRVRFRFDDEHGVFHAERTERPTGDELTVKVDVPARVAPAKEVIDAGVAAEPATAATLPTVEDELLQRQLESQALVRSLAAEPDNVLLQSQLKESLEQVRMDATLVDNPDAGDRARNLIDMLESPDFVPTHNVLDDLALVAPSPSPVVETIAPLVAPETEEEIDAELLDIFLTEAVEVLACVAENLPASRSAPHNQEYLTTLRRSFHTLKGSSRMVGLSAFGNTAWSIEQVLNLRLSEGQGNSEMYALVAHAASELGAWVLDMQTMGRSDRTGQALIDAAERVKNGEPFRLEESAAIVPSSPQMDEFDATASSSDSGPARTTVSTEENANVVPTASTTTDVDLSEPELGDDALASFDAFNAAVSETEVEVQETSDHAQEETVDVISPDPTASDAVTVVDEPVDAQAAESANETEQSPEPGKPIADVIDFPGNPMAVARVEDNIKRIGDLEISLPLHSIYLAETDELVRRLVQDFGEWRHEPDRQVSMVAVHAAHSLAGSSATVGFTPLHRLAHALELVLQYLSRKPVKLLLTEYDVLDQSVERIRDMLKAFALGDMPQADQEQIQALEAMLEDFEFRSLATTDVVVQTEEDVTFDQGIPLLSDVLAPALAVESTEIPDVTVEEVVAASPTLQESDYAPAAEERLDPTLIIRDEIDADLLPVFIEEGRDMLPQMAEILRAWQHNTGDTAAPQALLRLLHTVKGSARMAGAMTLGQHMHEMETRIENIAHAGYPSTIALEDLLSRYDHALQLFEQLQNGELPSISPAAVAAETDVVADDPSTVPAAELVEVTPLLPLSSDKLLPAPVTPDSRAVTTPAASPLVRVRADILDRLVNQAGEVSISRSRLETEVGTIRQSLGELSDNVSRLREQLREIEMQAESQITSSMGSSADREFDPLEFDRFTRLQELTRMMAESVSDVGTVQQTLHRTVESASTDLSAQARLTRDLQQDLMRVRMVQFASISERLYRVTRQASKEMDKRVNLDIRGSGVEIDRSVLEKMTGPFEHLLRNAIVHGIESREKRRAAGKNDIGELRIEVRQEGNEVVIQFSDDGQGLNIDGIRNKASAVGLLSDETVLSDAEVTDLIFHPGFSTAEEVTELAGRGIGMDVVRSEAASLGGRVAIVSEPGVGAQFTIHLPLTLAVTQVVLLATGGRIYAVPAVLVEQVQQLKSGALTQAYNDGMIMWQSHRVPMHYLSTLLGDVDAAPVTQQYSPLLILKSGAERIAIHVDEVIGSREVVVKNIGPQLSRMIGITGATVLGSGDIVLILNPVPLAQRAAVENQRAPRLSAFDTPDGMGAVAEMSSSDGTGTADPVQGLRTTPIVMVVDDSLTVRRVTQRLLTREGYQVVLAKDGVDALEHLQSVTPDVMLVDIEMPRMDGFDLTRNIRDDERTRAIPIIMITSRTAAKHRNFAMELGVNEYLGKPYQEDVLLELIAGFVGRYSSLDQQ